MMPPEDTLTAEPTPTVNPLMPEPIKLGDREQELVNLVTKNYYDTTQSTWYQNKIKEWKEYHEIALSKMEPSSFPWDGASNVDLGIIEMVCDNIKARFKISTIGSKPMFNTLPVTEAGERYKQQVTDSMNYILDNDIKIDEALDEISSNTVEYGTCVGKIYWRRDLVETKEYQSIEGIIFPIDKTTVEEKGALDIIDLTDIIVPEGAGRNIDKLPWIYHRVWYSLSDLQKKVELNFYTQEVVDKVKVGIQTEKEQLAKTPEEKLQVITKLPEEQVEVLECYQRYSVGEKYDSECIFWVCPKTRTYMKGFLLKDVYHKGKRPFKRWVYKETGSFYGRGVPEVLKPYRKLMNDVFNFGVNCLMLQILPWGFYRIGSSFRPEEVRLAPGIMVPVDDINDVKIAQFPVTATQAESLVQLVMSFVERQTGISSPHMGKEFPTRKTATEVKTIISEGNVKHEDRIQQFQSVCASMFKDIYNIYRQNQPEGRKGRVVEQGGEQARFVQVFAATDNLPDFDFIILGTLTTGNKVMEREDMMGLYAIASQNPIIAEYPDGQLEILKELFNTFGKRNLKRFLPPDQIIHALTQAKFAQVQQMMQGMVSGQQQMGAQVPDEVPEMPSPEGSAMPSAGLPSNPEVAGGGSEE
jgi:hypothetical protein